MASFVNLSKYTSFWKVVGYSVIIILMPFLGNYLGEISNVRYFLQSLEAIPVIVCFIFVLRLPKRPKLKMSRLPRLIFLLLPVPLFSFMNLGFFEVLFQQSPEIVALIFLEVIMIGVSEEFTFRFSLHRLWSQYSATFYVVVSSLIFGILHYRGGIESIIITTIIGVIFSLTRIAGMPIAGLIFLHGFIDIPSLMSSLGVTN